MYDTLYTILNKSENATLQYFIFCEKVLDEKYLLKITNVFQTLLCLSEFVMLVLHYYARKLFYHMKQAQKSISNLSYL